LQELNGHDVQLNKFIAASNDYSANIANWFGPRTLPGSGTLHARMCWQFDSLPVRATYEVAGMDSNGRTVEATLEVDFKTLSEKSGGRTIPMGLATDRSRQTGGGAVASDR